MLSNDQRKRYWVELHAALAVRPDLTREEFHRRHNLPASTKDFDHKKDFDTFLAACRAITQPANLKPQLRAFDQPKTRLLNKILIEQAAQLRALEIANPSEYIAQICFDKFHGRKPSDLSGPFVVQPLGCSETQSSALSPQSSTFSELEKLLFTIANRIKDLRQKRGWTVHELLWQSNLLHTCVCADCRRSRRPSQKVESVAPRPPSPELATADPF